jgi:hypothetical protein
VSASGGGGEADATGFASASGALALVLAAGAAPASTREDAAADEGTGDEPPPLDADLHAAATSKRPVHLRARTALLYYACGLRRPG